MPCACFRADIYAEMRHAYLAPLPRHTLRRHAFAYAFIFLSHTSYAFAFTRCSRQRRLRLLCRDADFAILILRFIRYCC